MNKFGTFLKELRLENKLSLRKFCIKAEADAGNISKIERGVIAPPGSEIIKRYAAALGLSAGSDNWINLFDLAATESGKIPSDIISNSKAAKLLPAFFRTLRNASLDEDKMLKLAEKIKEAGL